MFMDCWSESKIDTRGGGTSAEPLPSELVESASGESRRAGDERPTARMIGNMPTPGIRSSCNQSPSDKRPGNRLLPQSTRVLPERRGVALDEQGAATGAQPYKEYTLNSSLTSTLTTHCEPALKEAAKALDEGGGEF